jgi:ABC-2 type transport system ATP-binding protein
VILSSHILPEVQAICSRVIILNRGQIVAQDTPDILSRRVQGGWRYVLEVDGPPPQVEEVLRRVPGVEEVRFVRDELRGRERYEVSSGETDVRREMFFALAEARLPVLRLEPQEMTLEEIFLHLVTEETGEPEGEEAPGEEEEEEEGWA